VIDGRARRSVRRAEHDRLALLTSRGYAPAEGRLAVAVPRPEGEDAPPIDLWRRDGRAFIDGPGALRLRDAVDERWQSLAGGDARGPLVPAADGGPPGAAVLLEVEPAGGPRRAAAPTELRLATLRPGAEPPRHTATLAVNSDGLFDVSALVAI
jgi:hypothetical protein